jgi:hypothetical protein
MKLARDLKEKGLHVKLDHKTLSKLSAGGTTKSQSNAEKSSLLNIEANLVVDYAIATTTRGFPLSHKRLREHVNVILRARLGDQFPSDGVGKRWTNHALQSLWYVLGTGTRQRARTRGKPRTQCGLIF